MVPLPSTSQFAMAFQMHSTLLSSSPPKLGGVTTREKAHKLLDELPDSEIEPIVEIMASRGKGSASRLREYSPEEDEGPSAEEEAEAAKSPERLAAIEHFLRISNGDDDGYDFSVSEQLHAER
jgi:hypothetical protein